MSEINLLVLAGGFGTRLRSVVSDVPKPLAPVVDRPFLHYLVETWIAQGVSRLTFLLHYQAELIEAFLDLQRAERLLKGCEVVALREPQPLGTGGAVAFAVQQLRLSGSFLVSNADTWLGTGIVSLYQTPAPAMAIVRAENSQRYGCLNVTQNKIIGFEEKQDSAGPGWINAGQYHLHADMFADWNGQPFSLERELFPALAASGQLSAVLLQTEFIDIGVPDDYFRFGRWINSGRGTVL
jgi:D-glycero-alpha-D-manno-heptose 1-phosphate guanylyltransferase